MYRLFLALRLLRSRLVNLISVGGVMAGVAVLIVVTSVMDGFQAKVRRVLRGDISDLILVPRSDTPPPYAATVRRIREENPEVAAASPQVSFQVFYAYETSGRQVFSFGDGKTAQLMTAVGIDWEKEREASDLGGRILACEDPNDPFAFHDAALYERDTVIVGETFAERFLGLKTQDGRRTAAGLVGLELPLVFVELKEETREPAGPGTAESIRARVPTFRAIPSTINFFISGVFGSEDTSIDDDRIYLTREALRRLARIPDEYHEIRLKLADPETAPAMKQRFLATYSDFDTQTWEDQRRQFLMAVQNEKVLLVIVLSFIVLLGGFVILATLTLTVVEKTKDIGVLSALGAPRGGILSLFLFNGLLIGIIGAVFGVLLGRLFVDHVNDIKDFLADIGIQIFPPDIYLFQEIPTVWEWGTVAWIAGGSVLVAFLAGLVPALRAARMDPVKALRYE